MVAIGSAGARNRYDVTETTTDEMSLPTHYSWPNAVSALKLDPSKREATWATLVLSSVPALDDALLRMCLSNILFKLPSPHQSHHHQSLCQGRPSRPRTDVVAIRSRPP